MRIECLGAAQEVTGSCYLIHCNSRRVLVDCGLIQGGADAAVRNAALFSFRPAEVDAMVLTHAHLDHSGRIPLLIKTGFRGAIHAHRATCDLVRIMLKDAGNLNERDAETENRKRRRRGRPEIQPLFNVADAEAALEAFRPIAYSEAREIAPGITVRFQDAGHILGSAIVELWLVEGGRQRKVVFSGDLGPSGGPLMPDPATIKEANLVFLESTYGGRDHRDWAATLDELASVIREAGEGSGNILVPAFSVGRTQSLLHLLLEHHKSWGLANWYTFLDSPMGIEATAVYESYPELIYGSAARRIRRGENPFAPPNFQVTRTTEESMAINRIRSGALILAGSGMCTGGRILHHFKHNLWRREAHVVITGFQAEGTLGRALVDGADEVRLWGEPVRVAARIHTVGGLSAHAGRSGLLAWYGNFRDRPPVVLVHGEPSQMAALADGLHKSYGVAAAKPVAGESITID